MDNPDLIKDNVTDDLIKRQIRGRRNRIITWVIVLLILAAAAFIVWKYRGAMPVFRSPEKPITDLLPDSSSGEPIIPEAQNNTEFPLKLPKGFAISVFAKNLPGARVLAQDGFGNLWVSQTGEGKITQLEVKDGKVIRQSEVFKNLDRPHGLAIDGNTLYFAEETEITRVTLYSDDPGQKIADLPEGGRHFTRTLHFGSDGRLYVSIGSTCDVCEEKDERIATIYSMEKDGKDFKKVASGLRNSVFMATNPVDGKLWATEMGRDNLGDNLPPDEINIIDVGPRNSSPVDLNYGWPICYGKRIHDTNFDKKTYIQDPCNNTVASHIDLPAHSAPLGLSFIPEEGWPEEYGLDLIVAFHGSWNRTQPTGYKLARIKLDDKGNMEAIEDFISGWLSSDGKTSLGRPVDVLALPGGTMYVSDDKAGVVYKVQYLGNQATSDVQEVGVNVKENDLVTSPLKLDGKAKGWYFEGSFPAKILDEDGTQLGVGVMQATSDWMTTEFVPFEGAITFTKPKGATGTLLLENDNPSGLPEQHKEVRIKIRFR